MVIKRVIIITLRITHQSTINDTIMAVLEVLWELAMCQRHTNWPWQLEKNSTFIFGWCRTTVSSSVYKIINTVLNCTKNKGKLC